jgi:antitoxin component YwqK of YwqJK toxin-antitoxin module
MNQSFKVLSENERLILHFQLVNHNQAKFAPNPVSVDEEKCKWCMYRQIIFLTHLCLDDIVDVKKMSINSEGWFSGQIIKRFNNGNVALILNFKDGKLSGINKGWHENQPSQLHFKVDIERGRETVFYEGGQIQHLITQKKGVVIHNSYYINKTRSKQVKYFTPVHETAIHLSGGKFSRVLRNFPTYTNTYDINGKISSTVRTKGVYAFEKRRENYNNIYEIYEYFQHKRNNIVKMYLKFFHGVHKFVLNHSKQIYDIYKNNKKIVEIYENNRRVIFTLPNTPKGIVNTIKIK